MLLVLTLLSPSSRITEEILQESVDSRTEGLTQLRELGPPDLVHLLKQTSRSVAKPVRSHLSPSFARTKTHY